jgi:hypothetical protein
MAQVKLVNDPFLLAVEDFVVVAEVLGGVVSNGVA